MRKVKVSNNKSGFFMAIFVTGFMVVFFSFWYTAIFSIMKEDNEPMLWLFVLAPFIFFGIAFVIILNSLVPYVRYRKAMKGQKSTGKVVDIKIVSHTDSESHSVTYSRYVDFVFTNAKGEDRLCEAYVKFGDYDYFKKGVSIPIFVNGNCAFYDMDAIIKNAVVEVKEGNYDHVYEAHPMPENNEPQVLRCPCCGAIVDKGDRKCKYCDTKL